jgi:hypothetical protein
LRINIRIVVCDDAAFQCSGVNGSTKEPYRDTQRADLIDLSPTRHATETNAPASKKEPRVPSGGRTGEDCAAYWILCGRFLHRRGNGNGQLDCSPKGSIHVCPLRINGIIVLHPDAAERSP